MLNEAATLLVILSEKVSEEDMNIMHMFIDAIGTDPKRGWSRVVVMVYGKLKKKSGNLTNSKLLCQLVYPGQPTEEELANHNPLMKIIFRSGARKAKQDFFSRLFQRLPHKEKRRERLREDEVFLAASPPDSPMNFDGYEQHVYEGAEHRDFDDNTYEKQLSDSPIDEQLLQHHQVDFAQIHDIPESLDNQQCVNSPGRLYSSSGQPQSENQAVPIVHTRFARGDSGISSLSPPEFSPQANKGDIDIATSNKRDWSFS